MIFVSYNHGKNNKPIIIGGIKGLGGIISPGMIKLFLIAIILAILAFFVAPIITSTTEQAENAVATATTTANSGIKEYTAKPDNDFSGYEEDIKRGQFISKEGFQDGNYNRYVYGIVKLEELPIRIHIENGDSIDISRLENNLLYFTVHSSDAISGGFKASYPMNGGSAQSINGFFPEKEQGIRITEDVSSIYIRVDFSLKE